jgi:hypothetical protein
MDIKEKIKLIFDIISNKYVPYNKFWDEKRSDLLYKLEYAKLANDDLLNQINILNNLMSLAEQERLQNIRNDVVLDNYVDLWKDKK